MLGIVVLLATSLAARQAWLEKRRLPEGLIQANGRIEGDYIAVASKFAGRVSELLVRDGDSIVMDQQLVQLDDSQLLAQLNQAKHGVTVASAMVRGAEADVAAAAADVKAAETSLRLLRKQVPLAIDTALAELNHNRALLATADSVEGQKRSEMKRAAKLLDENAMSEEVADQKKLAWTVAQNELTTTGAAVTTAEKRLEEAKLGEDRIRERQDGLLALEAKHAKAIAFTDEAIARKQAAEAALDEAQSVFDDLRVSAPTAGTIVARFVDEGEVVSAGAPLLEIVDLDRLYLQVYVPENQIGKLRLGLPARIYTDAFPEQPFDATVRYIASEAEFTPREVQTKDERVKLVYAVRIYLDKNPDHCLTPGVPADAVVRWQEETPWTRPHW